MYKALLFVLIAIFVIANLPHVVAGLTLIAIGFVIVKVLSSSDVKTVRHSSGGTIKRNIGGYISKTFKK